MELTSLLKARPSASLALPATNVRYIGEKQRNANREHTAGRGWGTVIHVILENTRLRKVSLLATIALSAISANTPLFFPKSCRTGTYANEVNSYECKTCEKGTFQVLKGKTECEVCPPGHSCDNAESCPTPCPQGTFATNKDHYTGCKHCTKCPGKTGLTTCAKKNCIQNFEYTCPIEDTIALKLVSSFYSK
jgi:hypothetical protein